MLRWLTGEKRGGWEDILVPRAFSLPRLPGNEDGGRRGGEVGQMKITKENHLSQAMFRVRNDLRKVTLPLSYPMITLPKLLCCLCFRNEPKHSLQFLPKYQEPLPWIRIYAQSWPGTFNDSLQLWRRNNSKRQLPMDVCFGDTFLSRYEQKRVHHTELGKKAVSPIIRSAPQRLSRHFNFHRKCESVEWYL